MQAYSSGLDLTGLWRASASCIEVAPYVGLEHDRELHEQTLISFCPRKALLRGWRNPSLPPPAECMDVPGREPRSYWRCASEDACIKGE